VAHVIKLRGRLLGKDFIQMLKEFNGLTMYEVTEVLVTRRRLGGGNRS
jgi:hypothetical protein